ncbi:hypothetical protein LX36DRAFT_478824 [Colletotrichum falcatum]|nr:hypothetical protein LX36DRAFT_478824 [Colletotrichum falcatum]
MNGPERWACAACEGSLEESISTRTFSSRGACLISLRSLCQAVFLSVSLSFHTQTTLKEPHKRNGTAGYIQTSILIFTSVAPFTFLLETRKPMKTQDRESDP